MTALTASGPVAVAASTLESGLELAAPDLVAPFRQNLARAADVVARRVVGAAHREGLATAQEMSDGFVFVPGADLFLRADRFGFDRIEVAEDLTLDPGRLLERIVGRGEAATAIAAELADATANLALAYARRSTIDGEVAHLAAVTGATDSLDLAAGLDPDAQCVFFERLATEGHNLHPCGRTRLGWAAPDLLAYDLEAPVSEVGFLAVRRDLHIGDDLGPQLLPDADVDPGRYAVTPVHPWQLETVLRRRYADLIEAGALVPLADTLPAVPTAALRTLLLPGGRYLKVSLDIQVTSTRRTISVASTRNGPALSRRLESLVDDRVLLMTETAGSAMVAPDGRQRDLAAIVRSGLLGRLDPGEVAVPGIALCAVCPVTGRRVVAELVQRFARTRGIGDPATAALGFVSEYAWLLLPPVLELAARHGIGLEAHLQNCVPTFVDGVPHRLGLRDFAGLRVYPARLREPLPLWPGSVIVTGDVEVMLAKVGYTALQAHLGEIVMQLVGAYSLDERTAWSAVRAVVDEVYDGLGTNGGGPDRQGGGSIRRAAAADHAFLTAPTMPHKALLSMRLAPDRGDLYVRVENPLR